MRILRQSSKFERASLLFFQYVNKRVCPLPGNCFVVHGDISRRMICWKKTLETLVEAKASGDVREKFAVASKQNTVEQ